MEFGEVDCILDIDNELGEGIVWCDLGLVLYWVDIAQSELFRFSPSTRHLNRWKLDYQATAIAVIDSERLLLVSDIGLVVFNWHNERSQVLLEIKTPQYRSNDGRCDPQGRFWFSTMHRKAQESGGKLYSFDGQKNHCSSNTQDLLKIEHENGLGIPNSIAFHPDGHLFFLADTLKQVIYVYDLEPKFPKIKNRREWFYKKGVNPDGSTIDSNGRLWNAQWGRSCIGIFSSEDPLRGVLEKQVELPILQPSCCVFGGENLDILYVTSAWENLSEEQRKKYPLSGGIFAVQCKGVKGMPSPRFILGDRLKERIRV